jgi:hypothetical protein
VPQSGVFSIHSVRLYAQRRPGGRDVWSCLMFGLRTAVRSCEACGFYLYGKGILRNRGSGLRNQSGHLGWKRQVRGLGEKGLAGALSDLGGSLDSF